MFEKLSIGSLCELMESAIEARQCYERLKASGEVMTFESAEELAAAHAAGKITRTLQSPVFSDGLLAAMKETYESVGKYLLPTLEEWERDFMYDMHPGSEILQWGIFAEAIKLFWERRLKGRTFSARNRRKINEQLVRAICRATGAESLPRNVSRDERRTMTLLKRYADEVQRRECKAIAERIRRCNTDTDTPPTKPR